MSSSFQSVIEQYLAAKSLSPNTRSSYRCTLKKWKAWGEELLLADLGRKEVREFVDWVHEQAVEQNGTNPGRTANKARQNVRAVMAWAWEQDIIETLPRFPKPKLQRDVAGRHYLTKTELNALYFATHRMKRPRGWKLSSPVGLYWRSALVVFFNYGLDTGTVWKSADFHDPILWRHVFWDRNSPDRQVKQQSRWGWLFYRRVKTGKAFYRPMNRVVHAHIKRIKPDYFNPDDPVFLGGGARPNLRFQQLCNLAGIKRKINITTGSDAPWVLKDLRKTCATYYDEHMPESSIEILGHSVGGITYRHYAHRAPLAFDGGDGRASNFSDYCPSCFARVRTAATDQRRCGHRRHQRESLAARPSDHAWFDTAVGETERCEAIEHALAKLPTEQREALVMRTWAEAGETTFQQIRDALGVSSKTAAARYGDAVDSLCKILSEGSPFVND